MASSFARNRKSFILLIKVTAVLVACSCSERKPSHPNAVDKPAASLPHMNQASWSRYGWATLRWGMGPGDAIPILVKATPGETWRTTDEDRTALGMAVDLAHAAVLKDPIHGQEVKATLKFSDRTGLLGVVLRTPVDGGLTRWRCSSVFEKLQSALKNELGPGKDGVSIFSDTPRTEWLTDTMRLKLTQQLEPAGCFVQMSYVDPGIYKD